MIGSRQHGTKVLSEHDGRDGAETGLPTPSTGITIRCFSERISVNGCFHASSRAKLHRVVDKLHIAEY